MQEVNECAPIIARAREMVNDIGERGEDPGAALHCHRSGFPALQMCCPTPRLAGTLHRAIQGVIGSFWLLLLHITPWSSPSPDCNHRQSWPLERSSPSWTYAGLHGAQGTGRGPQGTARCLLIMGLVSMVHSPNPNLNMPKSNLNPSMSTVALGTSPCSSPR